MAKWVLVKSQKQFANNDSFDITQMTKVSKDGQKFRAIPCLEYQMENLLSFNDLRERFQNWAFPFCFRIDYHNSSNVGYEEALTWITVEPLKAEFKEDEYDDVLHFRPGSMNFSIKIFSCATVNDLPDYLYAEGYNDSKFFIVKNKKGLEEFFKDFISNFIDIEDEEKNAFEELAAKITQELEDDFKNWFDKYCKNKKMFTFDDLKGAYLQARYDEALSHKKGN